MYGFRLLNFPQWRVLLGWLAISLENWRDVTVRRSTRLLSAILFYGWSGDSNPYIGFTVRQAIQLLQLHSSHWQNRTILSEFKARHISRYVKWDWAECRNRTRFSSLQVRCITENAYRAFAWMKGYDPFPPVFQTGASTKLASFTFETGIGIEPMLIWFCRP